MKKKKEYHKPLVLDTSKTNTSESVLLAGVRATQTLILKQEMKKK